MERSYRLEFNEAQQFFHLDSGRAEPNTHGWITVIQSCTDSEFRVFESFVNRVKRKKLTNKYVLKCATEFKGFMSNLNEYGVQIVWP